MKCELYHDREKKQLEIAIYPESAAEEVMFQVMHENKCIPVLAATGNQPYFCRVRIKMPIEL